MKSPGTAKTPALYDTDFFAWTEKTVENIRSGRLEQVDLEHVAEEIEDMGKRDLRELNSRIQTILVHLLKCRFQPEKFGVSWSATIVRERGRIERILEQSPSLKRKSEAGLDKTYRLALREASVETGLPRSTFPAQCPYSYEQILDFDFTVYGS